MRIAKLLLPIFYFSVPISAEEIALTFKDRAGQGYENQFVCSGFPLARGMVKDASFSLRDGAGKEVPAFVRPLVRWADGSVKWMQVQTQLSVSAGGSGNYALSPGKPAVIESPWQVQDDADALSVSNGPLAVVFAKSGNELLRSVKMGGKEIMKSDGKPQMILAVDHTGPGNTDEENWLRDAKANAQLEEAHGVLENFHIDEKTPFRFIVRGEGGIVSKSGERKCSFVIRYFLFRNSPRMKVEWTLIWDCDSNKNFLRMCALRFPAKLAGGTAKFSGGDASSLKITGANHASLVATKPDVKVHQIPLAQAKSASVSIQAGAPGATKKVADGTEVSGWVDVSAGGTNFCVAAQRFVQRYPKEIAVSETGVDYYLWPESTNQLLDFRNYRVAHVKKPNEGKRWEGGVVGRAEGTATTERLWLDFSGGASGEKLKAQMAKRPLLKAAPQHYIGSGVFGPVHPFDPQKFPEYEGVYQAMLYWLVKSPDHFKWHGLLNDGAMLMEFNWAAARKWEQIKDTWMCRGYSGWAMDDGGQSWSILLAWLRTGGDDFFDFAELTMNHAIDVSCVHAETEQSVKAHSHGRPAIGGSRRHNAQHWGDYISSRGANAYGKVFFYLLTGEPRYLDVIAEGTWFESIYWSYENWTMVGSLSLAGELYKGLKENDPYFETKRQERLKRIALMQARAKKLGWRQAMSACRLYLDVEKRMQNPQQLIARAGELLKSKVNAKRLDFIADGVVSEGVKYYELAHGPGTADAKYAREFLLTAANEVMEGRGDQSTYAKLVQGRAMVMANEIQPDPKYAAWIRKRMDEMFYVHRYKAPYTKHLRLRRAAPDAYRRNKLMALWRALAPYDSIPAQKIGHIHGMVLGRLPYFLHCLAREK